MTMRLNKFIASAGVCSRRHADMLIASGKIKVNAVPCLTLGKIIDPLLDQISLDDKILSLPEMAVTYILNKPKGYVTSHKRIGKEKIVYDLFDTSLRLFSIGRLDKDTTGLLLLTTDGTFSHRVIHPSSSIEKEYVATLEEILEPHHLTLLRERIKIEDDYVTPKRVQLLSTYQVSITVMEGKKREVRHMIEKSGLTLKELKRIRIGNLKLGALRIGAFRLLSPQEKELIFN